SYPAIWSARVRDGSEARRGGWRAGDGHDSRRIAYVFRNHESAESGYGFPGGAHEHGCAIEDHCEGIERIYLCGFAHGCDWLKVGERPQRRRATTCKAIEEDF